MSDIDLDLPANSPIPSNKNKSEGGELYFLFRPHTTGLLKIKKTKGFKSYEEAFQSGLALNILDGTPDKLFIILKQSDIHTHSSITDELPFTENFFRYSRLSDSVEKFKQTKNELTFPRNEMFPGTAQILAGLSINPEIISQSNQSELDIKKGPDKLFEEAGLTPQNAVLLQSYLQYKLGISPSPPIQFPELNRFLDICYNTELFPKLNEANRFISRKIMERNF